MTSNSKLRGRSAKANVAIAACTRVGASSMASRAKAGIVAIEAASGIQRSHSTVPIGITLSSPAVARKARGG